MNKIDYKRELTFGTILKLVTPTTIIMWSLVAAWLFYQASTGAPMAALNGEQAYGNDIPLAIIQLCLLLGTGTAFLLTFILMFSQPIDRSGIKVVPVWADGFAIISVLNIGYRLLSLIMTPSIKYKE